MKQTSRPWTIEVAGTALALAIIINGLYIGGLLVGKELLGQASDDDFFRQFELMNQQGNSSSEETDPFATTPTDDFPFSEYEDPFADYSSDPFMNNGEVDPFATPPDPSLYPSAPEEDFVFPEPPEQIQVQPLDKPFTDEPLHSAANQLRERGVLRGRPDGSFDGKASINRAEVLAMLIRARMGEPSAVPVPFLFSDADANAWYAPYLAFGSYYGIVTGYPDGTVKPSQQVTGAEFMKMMTMTFGMKQGMPHSYIDVQEGDWFDPYVGNAELYALWPERGVLFNPHKPLTRTEVAAAIGALLLQQ